MKTTRTTPTTIDEYIAGFPPDVQAVLQKIRTTISKAAPAAEEAIAYQIPTFRLHGNLIHFAAFKKHIGVYPAPRRSEAFMEELSAYEGGKGTLRFSLDRPVPLDLIRRIVRFRVKENASRADGKAAKKRQSRA